jgi:hypothetical protein
MIRYSIYRMMKKSFNSALSAVKRFAYTKLSLYIVFGIALANLYSILVMNDLVSLLVFIAAGLVATLYSANMVAVLIFAIVVSNIARWWRLRTEGFDGDGDGDGDALVGIEGGAGGVGAAGSEPTEADEGRMEKFKESYRELMQLQDDIMEGIERVNKPLEKAETIVSGLKESMLSRRR